MLPLPVRVFCKLGCAQLALSFISSIFLISISPVSLSISRSIAILVVCISKGSGMFYFAFITSFRTFVIIPRQPTKSRRRNHLDRESAITKSGSVAVFIVRKLLSKLQTPP